jgi:hypothetical protein
VLETAAGSAGMPVLAHAPPVADGDCRCSAPGFRLPHTTGDARIDGTVTAAHMSGI